MSRLLESIEPDARPARRSLLVAQGEEIGLYALDLAAGGPRGLRRTVLRRRAELPPEGAALLAWFRVDASGLTTTHVGRHVVLELVRADGRNQVIDGMRLPLNAVLDVTLPDGGRLAMGLLLHGDEGRRTGLGVAGSGTRTSRVRFAKDNVWWLITDSKGILVSVVQGLWDRARDALLAMGIDSRVQTFLQGIITPLIIAGVGAFGSWWFYSASVEEAARADEAESALALAQAAQAASLATELSCLQQRQDLVAQLGKAEEAKALAAETALALPLTNTVAVELGGTRMASEDTRAIDDLYRPNLIQGVVSRMAFSEGDADPCLGQVGSLGPDLPRYLLLYHPDPAMVCPLDYAAEDGGVRRLGRWGLSDRLATEFGGAGDASTGTAAGTLGTLLEDPRYEDRWAAFTLARAYREILETLLSADRSPRPPVLPSEAHVWALALLDAYNRLPSPAGGSLDASARTCVSAVLRSRVEDAPPAAPGEPLLPDLASVAADDIQGLALKPTPGCPWPRGSLRAGADAALRAAAHLADASAVAGDAAND